MECAQQKFARLTYSDAVSLLSTADQTFEFPVSWGTDLQSEHERFITEQKDYASVVVTDYLKEIKAFLHALK